MIEMRATSLAGSMANEADCRAYLSANCPNVWSLLNQGARKCLPPGLVEYLSPPNAAIGKSWLAVADKHIELLVGACGLRIVGDAYRRDLSGVATERQLAELLCEIMLCSEAAKLSSTVCLRPDSGKGTACDVSFQLSGVIVFGEAKRYEDNWPPTDEEPAKPIMRSLVKAPLGAKPQESARPRSMDLRSKLQNVPCQFPDGTLNLLFIFHSSLGESPEYIQQTLFGEHTVFLKSDQVALEEDGLFASEEWRAVSGCCLSKVLPGGELICPVIWENPRALVPIPTPVRAALDRLNFPACGKRWLWILIATLIYSTVFNWKSAYQGNFFIHFLPSLITTFAYLLLVPALLAGAGAGIDRLMKLKRSSTAFLRAFTIWWLIIGFFLMVGNLMER